MKVLYGKQLINETPLGHIICDFGGLIYLGD